MGPCPEDPGGAVLALAGATGWSYHELMEMEIQEFLFWLQRADEVADTLDALARKLASPPPESETGP